MLCRLLYIERVCRTGGEGIKYKNSFIRLLFPFLRRQEINIWCQMYKNFFNVLDLSHIKYHI